MFIKCLDVCVQVYMCSTWGEKSTDNHLKCFILFYCFLAILYNTCETGHIESNVLLSLSASCYLRSGWATISDRFANYIFWLLVAMNKCVSVEAVDLKYKFSKYLLF